MAPGVNRAVLTSLVAAGIGVAGLAGLAVWLAVAAGQAGAGMLAVIAAAAGLVAVGLWAAGLRLRDHVDRLERLRGDVLVATAHDEMLAPRSLAPATDEIGRLASTLADSMERQRLRRADPDTRLAAVVAAAAEGLLVVTESGLVSLANAAALSRLGEERTLVGTSVYDVLHRSELAAAMAEARAAGQPIAATLTTIEGEALEVRLAVLGDAGGIVVSLPRGDADHPIGIHHDLALHEEPPPPPAITAATPLDDLPVIVLDTETTGLDTANDRVVSIGAVRLHGARIFRHLTFDRLVDPGQPIPARATAVHGISTAMVAGAPPVSRVLPAVCELLSGVVVVGHCIGFDLEMLKQEAARAGVAWVPPPALDTMLLAAALFAQTDELSLDALAERLGVAMRGRHTALGDALVTAEIYARLLPLMIDQGVATFGAVLALAARPRKVVAQQRAAGWGGE